MLRLTVLGSGSSGNCAVVATEQTTLLIDAGLSAKQIVLRLEASGISLDALDGIVLTHEHGDHTRGLEILCGKREIQLFCTPLTQEALLRDIRFRRSPQWRLMQSDSVFAFRDVRIESFQVPHDAVDPVGLVIEDDESRLGILSDVGFVTNLIRERLRHSHTLFLEANYDTRLLEADTKRPWATKQRISSRHGHLSNDQVAELVEAIAHEALNHVVLGHLSEDCNDPGVASRRISEALRNTRAESVRVWCAERNKPGPTLEVARRGPKPQDCNGATAAMEQPALFGDTY